MSCKRCLLAGWVIHNELVELVHKDLLPQHKSKRSKLANEFLSRSRWGKSPPFNLLIKMRRQSHYFLRQCSHSRRIFSFQNWHWQIYINSPVKFHKILPLQRLLIWQNTKFLKLAKIQKAAMIC